MRFILKVLAFLGSAVLVCKLAQMLIDYLYETRGKRYISTDYFED